MTTAAAAAVVATENIYTRTITITNVNRKKASNCSSNSYANEKHITLSTMYYVETEKNTHIHNKMTLKIGHCNNIILLSTLDAHFILYAHTKLAYKIFIR